MPSSRAGQHTLREHEHPGPLGEVVRGRHHSSKAFTDGECPAVSGSRGYMLNSGDVGLEDGGEGRERGHRKRGRGWKEGSGHNIGCGGGGLDDRALEVGAEETGEEEGRTRSTGRLTM